jgi:hypothetical protein
VSILRRRARSTRSPEAPRRRGRGRFGRRRASDRECARAAERVGQRARSPRARSARVRRDRSAPRRRRRAARCCGAAPILERRPQRARHCLGETKRLELVRSTSDEVGYRLHVSYRLRKRSPAILGRLSSSTSSARSTTASSQLSTSSARAFGRISRGCSAHAGAELTCVAARDIFQAARHGLSPAEVGGFESRRSDPYFGRTATKFPPIERTKSN